MSRTRTNRRGDSRRLKWKGIRGWATLKEPLSDAGNSLLTLGPCIGRLNGFSQPYYGLPDPLKQGGGSGQKSAAAAGFFFTK